jgi:hypothetical protein
MMNPLRALWSADHTGAGPSRLLPSLGQNSLLQARAFTPNAPGSQKKWRDLWGYNEWEKPGKTNPGIQFLAIEHGGMSMYIYIYIMGTFWDRMGYVFLKKI